MGTEWPVLPGATITCGLMYPTAEDDWGKIWGATPRGVNCPGAFGPHDHGVVLKE